MIRRLTPTTVVAASRPQAPPNVMAGLVPTIHEDDSAAMRGAWVYIVTNRPNGTLYVGVTGDIARRAHEHREGLVVGFTKRYGLRRLVWYEPHQSIVAAIQREKAMKHWPRAWKVRLILGVNPAWDDLYGDVAFVGPPTGRWSP